MALYCISVREKQGADILHDLLGNTVEVVLDPTLLMGINEWKEIAKPYTNKKKKYVFAYTLAVSDTIMKFTKGLSKEKGIDLILISDNMWKRHDAIYAKAVSPEEFIDLFYNASYVV
ncbi:MAG: polysaccharide pyruvyl transferase family protein, partial [Bacillota bacterium]|nr:polysaccharide pyruvyl transferase family protein [Bacillota bacterium]